MFTEVQIKECIENNRCPFCGKELSWPNERDYATIQGDQALENVTCQNCKKSWTEVYQLADIE
jgi:C4-type Zn-finger protein